VGHAACRDGGGGPPSAIGGVGTPSSPLFFPSSMALRRRRRRPGPLQGLGDMIQRPGGRIQRPQGRGRRPRSGLAGGRPEVAGAGGLDGCSQSGRRAHDGWVRRPPVGRRRWMRAWRCNGGGSASTSAMALPFLERSTRRTAWQRRWWFEDDVGGVSSNRTMADSSASKQHACRVPSWAICKELVTTRLVVVHVDWRCGGW
jgi:hypothetical protein